VKLTIDIDCTPQEARQFLGLPDVEALNDMIVAETTARMKSEIDTLADPEKYMARAMGMTGKGMETMQAMMMNAMSGKSGKKE